MRVQVPWEVVVGNAEEHTAVEDTLPQMKLRQVTEEIQEQNLRRTMEWDENQGRGGEGAGLAVLRLSARLFVLAQ